MGPIRVPAFIVRRAAACLAGVCLAALCLAAAPAEGVRTYLADLAVPGGSLRLVLRLTDGGDATIDIPAQGIERMALEVTGGPGGALTMRIPVPVPAFMDLKEADGGLAGTFRQAAFSAPVSFRPGEPNKPQDPKPPLPYTVREVEVRHPAGHVLAGTLVVPPVTSSAMRSMPCAGMSM
ncbi:MAG: hypothetical protein ACKOF7_02790, partial [Phycisphaerales bacterium]